MLQYEANQSKGKLTLLIYMESLTRVLIRKRTVIGVDSLNFGTIKSQGKEIQSALDQFYEDVRFSMSDISGIDLVFVNTIFHETSNGNLECYKNRLPSFLLYHKEYFPVPVTHKHIAILLTEHLIAWKKNHDQPGLWFHLRKKHLYVLFVTLNGEYSIKSFEVHKTLDVYYYILFNIQTLEPVLPELKEITISGELINMDQIHNFFTNNVPEKNLITFWQWRRLLGRPQPDISPFLPEVNI